MIPGFLKKNKKIISPFLVYLLLFSVFPLFSSTITSEAQETYRFVSKWGSFGSGDGQFSSPQGIAVDSSGNVYVTDTQNNRIQKFDSSDTFLTKWGSFGTGNIQFDSPQGIAIDSSGNVYGRESCWTSFYNLSSDARPENCKKDSRT